MRRLLGLESVEHMELEEWTRLFSGTAILGFICTLLLAGKFVHHIFQYRGLVFGLAIIPPVILSGLLGLTWFSIMECIDPVITSDLRSGLEVIAGNLINFVFAALILGLTCSRSNSLHYNSFRGIFTSIIHEGTPMIVYSQILQWGQSTCCIFVMHILNFFNFNIPSLFPAFIPVGIEAGSDINISSQFKSYWSETVVEEAESLGLVAVMFYGIFFITVKPYLISKGLLGSTYSRELNQSLSQGSGQAEAFEKQNRSFNKSSVDKVESVGLIGSQGLGSQQLSHVLAEDFDTYNADKSYHERKRDGEQTASLGSHLSLIALTVFLSFGCGLLLHLLEIELKVDHHILSGVRMFKLSMCCALASMHFLLRRSRIRFNREWFMRLCGLMLDLLLISALAKAYPKPRALEKTTHYLLCSLFVLVCLAWNLFCFVYVARHLFPNYWYERGLTLTGDAMGHSYTGLLFARTMDPAMESPVPAAYAYKLMLFFIPSSAAKNTIIVAFTLQHGAGIAFLISLCVLMTWVGIFDMHFKNQYSSDAALSKEKGEVVFPADGIPRSTSKTSFDETADLLESSNGSSSSNPIVTISSTKTSVTSRRSNSLAQLAAATPSSVKIITEDSVSINPLSGVTKVNGDHITMQSQSPEIPLKTVHINATEPSLILTPEQMNIIGGWLSESIGQSQWRLSYSLRQHGASLDSLLASTTQHDNRSNNIYFPSIIVIEDSWGYVFGGYIAPSIQAKHNYYGNGECFVFSVAPVPRVYRWTGANDLFVISNEKIFALGGGGEGFALQIDDELDTGVSNRSATFANETLSSSEFFKCLNVEVWTLDHQDFSV